MLVHAVLAELRYAISRGEFRPGEKLNEVAVASHFDVSRNTLREAFAVLSAEGLAQRIPNRGVFIAEPTPAFVDDLYRSRAALEPAALRWGEFLDFSSLRATVDHAAQVRDAGNFDEVALANQQFHRLIVAGMGSDTLNSTMDQLLARMRLAFLTIQAMVPDFHSPYVDHNRELVNLLENDEHAVAADTLHENLGHTARRLKVLLERQS